MRLDARAGAISASAVSALAYLLGAVLHVALPWGAPALVSFLFRVDIVELAMDFSLVSAGTGLLMFAFFGALFGYLGIRFYNGLVAPTVSKA